MSAGPLSLADVPLFAGCRPQTLAEWEKNSILRKHAEGELILEEKQAPEHVYTLLSGSVRVFYTGPGGVRFMAKLFSAPAFFGEMEAIVNIPHLEGVDAVTTCRVLTTPRQVFFRSVREEPTLASRLLVDLSARLCVSARLERAVAFGDVEARLCSLLLSYARVWGVPTGSEVQISRPVEVSELADNLGVNRKSVQRAFAVLEEQAWIRREGKRLFLKDFNAIREAAGEVAPAVDYSLKQVGGTGGLLEHLTQLGQAAGGRR